MSRLALAALVFIPTLIAAADDHVELPFRVRDGFHVEQVYAVPRDSQGSWVALAIDDRGRLIASDQQGGLYRITVPGEEPTRADPIELPVGHAHGLLYAFESLYVVVADDAHQGPGLYRLRDTDGDDTFDQVVQLQSFEGTGEHGPHSVILSPDGESLLIIAGNKTAIPEPVLANSLAPQNWGEDDLLPRLWGPIGSEAGTPAPGGWVARTDPDGKNWQLLAVGLRNGFDLAFNSDDELFTVDADAEFDLGTPWYQPTRVFHIVEGTDYGWRSGSGKRPPHYADTLPPVIELGPGSPTGIVSGRGTSFPPRYQDALFVGDWSRGRLLAVALEPEGSSYTGMVEEIVTGTPLPVSDLVVHPQDGAIYFALGGRGVTSGLYRLSWTGEAADQPPKSDSAETAETQAARLRQLRRQLAGHLNSEEPMAALEAAWPQLSHPDRTVRHTARLVLEHMPHRYWQDRAFTAEHPLAQLTALLALARADDETLLPKLVGSLTDLPWETLSRDEHLLWLRTADVALTRLASHPLDETIRNNLLEYLEPLFPVGRHTVDVELCRLLVSLQSPTVPAVALQLIDDSVTQQQRLSFAVPLRHQRAGWTPELRQQYFALLADASHWQGGLSLSKYIERIADEALAHVPAKDREVYAELLQQSEPPPQVLVQREFVRKWTLSELIEESDQLSDGEPEAGRRLFAELRCFTCHRFQGEGGGVGPDLTTVVRRLNTRDLLEAIIEPDKVISDQFAASLIITDDGRIVTGRVVNLLSDALLVQTDMLKPAALERIPRDEIESMEAAKTSMMPAGLLNTASLEEIADLLAFLRKSDAVSPRQE